MADKRRLRLYEDSPKTGDDRSEFQRDRDIILYTSALQRLSGITQVVSGETGHVFHNRLTHTLQVAQVGRRLAEKLHVKQKELAVGHGGVDPDVVEAACLAHDLGHPPFGHLAEYTLNRLVGEEVEGFEGNAQSFRIVTELAFRSEKYPGLNLTWATLRAILKYPWTYECRPSDKRGKWGAYRSELPSFQHATESDGRHPVSRSVEAEIMDWADDVTYSIHDVEDFYRAGLIPLHLLKPRPKGFTPDIERRKFLEYVWQKRASIAPLRSASQQDIDEIFANLMLPYFSLEGRYEATKAARGKLRTFTSQLVGRYINGLKLADPSADRPVVLDKGFEQEIAILKQLTWFYVIEASGLAMLQHSQRQVIRCLFGVFMHETRKTPSLLLPQYYRERLQSVSAERVDGNARRVVADLIAGMTESQAIAVYHRLNGITSASAMEKILV